MLRIPTKGILVGGKRFHWTTIEENSLNVTEINRAGGLVSEAAVLVGVSVDERRSRTNRSKSWPAWPKRPGAASWANLPSAARRRTSTTYLGKGKVDELRSYWRSHRRRRDHLRQRSQPGPNPQPGKGHELKVLDRTELILDIFASRRRRTKPAWPSSWRSCNTRCRG